MRKLFLLSLIIILGFIVYSNSFSIPFIWDDHALIKKNYFIKDIRYLPKLFTTDIYSASGQKSFFYRPLYSLSLMLDYYLFGLKIWGYHLSNLLFHILVAILVYRFIFLISKDLEISFLSAVFFVIHPLHIEAVSYISGRAEPLAGIFIFLSLILFLEKRYIFSLFSFFLALFCKEFSLVLPLMILFLNKSLDKRAPFKVLIFYFLIGASYLLLRFILFKGLLDFSSEYSLYRRVLCFINLIPEYIRLLFLPFNLHMSYSVKIPDPLSIEFLSSAIFFFSTMFLLFKTYKKENLLSLAGGIYFIFLFPYSGIFSLPAFMAEHFLYFSSVGFFLFLAVYIKRYLLKKPFCFLLVGIVFFYGFSTFFNNLNWINPIYFYKRIIKLSPFSFAAYNNLGILYEEKKRYPQAEKLFLKALEIKPDFLKAKVNLARIKFKKGETPQAIAILKSTLKTQPDLIEVYLTLAGIYADKRDYLKALQYYKKVIFLTSPPPSLYNSLGLLYNEIGNYKLAIEMFRNAISLDRKDSSFYNNLGIAYKNNQNYDLAIQSYQKALKLSPQASIYSNLGIVYRLKGSFLEAEKNFLKAIELEPKNPQFLYNLGLLYWEEQRPKKASAYWRKALDLIVEDSLLKEQLKRLISQKDDVDF